jgi:hypothetical protein
MYTKIAIALLIGIFIAAPSQAQEKKKSGGASGVLKNLKPANLTEEQISKVNDLGKATMKEIKEIKNAHDISGDLIKKRTTTLKEIKKEGLKGAALKAALKEKAGLSDKQIEGFDKIDGVRKKLLESAVALLTDEQKATLPKRFLKGSKKGKKNTKVKGGDKAKAPVVAKDAGALGTLIFEDDFERSESQEDTDEPGNGWNTNSKSRAKNDKQVDLKDGAMHISLSKKADHGVSVTHDAAFQDGTVKLRFKFEKPEDSLGLNFADMKFKEVHAGHLCMTKISTKNVTIDDLKTGKMDLKTRDAKKANKLTDEMKEALKAKTKRFKNPIKVGEWHDLEVTIADDSLSVSIDNEKIGSFSSEGIAHPTKRTLRVAVPKNAVIDDVKIYKKK